MKGAFNERLSELIKERKMTQKKVASEAGVTESAMSHYLKGDRIPRASVLSKIADVLGTTSDYLMNGTASSPTEEYAYAKRLIARNASQMSHEEKMEIISILLNNE